MEEGEDDGDLDEEPEYVEIDQDLVFCQVCGKVRGSADSRVYLRNS